MSGAVLAFVVAALIIAHEQCQAATPNPRSVAIATPWRVDEDGSQFYFKAYMLYQANAVVTELLQAKLAWDGGELPEPVPGPSFFMPITTDGALGYATSNVVEASAQIHADVYGLENLFTGAVLAFGGDFYLMFTLPEGTPLNVTAIKHVAFGFAVVRLI